MWTRIGVVAVSVSCFAWNAPRVRAAQCPGEPVIEEFHIDSASPMLQRQLQRVISGAARRLSRCACQTIFTDFRDDSGQALESRLDALHQSGAKYLYTLRFVDSRDSPYC